MNIILRIILTVLLLFLTGSYNLVLTQLTNDWENPKVISKNKQDGHSTYTPYDSIEESLADTKAESRNILSCTEKIIEFNNTIIQPESRSAETPNLNALMIALQSKGRPVQVINQELRIRMTWMRQYRSNSDEGSDNNIVLGKNVVGHGSSTSTILRVDLDNNLVIAQSRRRGGRHYETYLEKLLVTLEENLID